MVEIIQGSDEWKQIRCGKVTASKIADLTAKTKTGYSAGRANYMAQLVAERLTETVEDGFKSPAMQWGNDTEEEARNTYAFIYGMEVTEVAFVEHPHIAMSGASPDGLVGADGLVEIKCPNTATHINTLKSGKVPTKYVKQMVWQLACTDRKWCDFVSFDPRLPVNMQLFVKRLERDELAIQELEDEVKAFLLELDLTVAELTEKYAETA